jgi:hypothetical protein
MISYKTKAIELGFTLVQDCKTNIVHLGNDEKTNAICNSRFIVFPTEPHYADDFGCTRCIKKIDKILNG